MAEKIIDPNVKSGTNAADTTIKVNKRALSNVVDKKAIREVQKRTTQDLASRIMPTFGPKGSDTMVIIGERSESLHAKYTKDGKSVLKQILYNGPLEQAITNEFVNAATEQELRVGDATSSCVILADLIFRGLCAYEENETVVKKTPYQIKRDFARAVDIVKKEILSRGRECTLDDIYDIAYISTNGNHEVAQNLRDIYEQYGMDVYIEVTASTGKDTYLKEYDGITFDVGYSDEAYINTAEGRAEIDRPEIFYFKDPIDNREQMALFNKIILDNLMLPLRKNEPTIPTVIITPIMTRDLGNVMEAVCQTLHQFDNGGNKPMFNVITNIGIYADEVSDVCSLCGCKTIQKYIDPEMEKEDIANGIAPTMENIHTFAGHADQVVSDFNKTKFIKPAAMYNEDGTTSNVYNSHVNFLDAELNSAQRNGADLNVIGRLKRRLQSLKACMVEYMVGGIAISDRENLKDLLQDAVLNCRSAAVNGVGYAANFEGLRAVLEVSDWDYIYQYGKLGYHTRENDNVMGTKNRKRNMPCDIYFDDEDQKAYQVTGKFTKPDHTERLDVEEVPDLYDCCYGDLHYIFAILQNAYRQIVLDLYATDSIDLAEVNLQTSLLQGKPLNLHTGKWDGKVITSIDTDIAILETISKIIMLLFSSNQAIVQTPMLNVYFTND